jgi:hypothetical protein
MGAHEPENKSMKLSQKLTRGVFLARRNSPEARLLIKTLIWHGQWRSGSTSR